MSPCSELLPVTSGVGLERAWARDTRPGSRKRAQFTIDLFCWSQVQLKDLILLCFHSEIEEKMPVPFSFVFSVYTEIKQRREKNQITCPSSVTALSLESCPGVV